MGQSLLGHPSVIGLGWAVWVFSQHRLSGSIGLGLAGSLLGLPGSTNTGPSVWVWVTLWLQLPINNNTLSFGHWLLGQLQLGLGLANCPPGLGLAWVIGPGSVSLSGSVTHCPGLSTGLN